MVARLKLEGIAGILGEIWRSVFLSLEFISQHINKEDVKPSC